MKKLKEYEINILRDFVRSHYEGEELPIEDKVLILDRCIAVIFENTPLFKRAITEETRKWDKERAKIMKETHKQFKKFNSKGGHLSDFLPVHKGKGDLE